MRRLLARRSCWPRWPSALIGALIEWLVLRRIYRAPELFQLLATFALVLIIRDAALAVWGSEDLLGPRAPGLRGSVEILGRSFPQYDLRADRHRAADARAAVVDADPHPLRNPGAGRHPGPRDGRRARCQPVVAVHRRVRPRRVPRRTRRRAAAAARAGQPRPRPGRDRRGLRGGGGRRHGQHSGRIPRGAADRRVEGGVHRHRPGEHRRGRLLVLEAHAGGRVPGDGGGPDLAARGACSGGRSAISRNAAEVEPPLRAGPGWLRVLARWSSSACCCCCRCSANAIRTWWC